MQVQLNNMQNLLQKNHCLGKCGDYRLLTISLTSQLIKIRL